ncbi:MAG: hypothetical protein ACYC25_02335 [Paludibacter sp.]
MKLQTLSKILFLTLIILGLNGCEYELSKENFRDLQKPSDTHSFSLNLYSSQDTILIYDKVNLSYNFNTDNLKVWEIKFSIDDKVIESTQNTSGVITLDAGNYSAGIYKLKATIYTHSGTTSIADNLGAEGYMVEKEWILEINNYYAPVISPPVVSRTKEGFLKISWEKFDKPDLFVSYNLELPSNGEVVIRNINVTSIVDSMYIGFGYSTMMYVLIKGENNNRSSNYASTRVSYKFPVIHFEKIGFDSLRLYWNQSTYKTKYHVFVNKYYPHYLYDATTDLLKNNLDTSIIIHQAGFEDYSAFDLQIESYTTTAGRNPLKSTMNTVFYHWGLYFVNLGGLNLSYNLKENVLYYTVYGYVYSCDISTFQNIKSVWWSPTTTGNNACPTNSTKVAVLSPTNLYIYDNKNLDTYISMPLQRDPDYMSMSDNELVVMTSQNNGLEYISVANKKIITTQPLTSYTSANQWSVTSSSNDAKYTCVVSSTGINIFEFNNPFVSKSYTASDVYRSCLFDKNSIYTLYLTKENSDMLEIRNATDFSLINTIKMNSSNAFLCNVDPLTGFLLTADLSNAYFISLKTGKTIYSIRCTSSKPRLFGGKLISGNGLYIDISEKLHE